MSQGFLDGYAGLKLELPNGRMVTAKVLPLAKAAHYLALWTQKNQAGHAQILAEFPKDVGLETELNELTLSEFWDVFDVFFDRRGKPGTSPPPTPTPIPIGTAS